MRVQFPAILPTLSSHVLESGHIFGCQFHLVYTANERPTTYRGRDCNTTPTAHALRRPRVDFRHPLLISARGHVPSVSGQFILRVKSPRLATHVVKYKRQRAASIQHRHWQAPPFWYPPHPLTMSIPEISPELKWYMERGLTAPVLVRS